MDLNGLKHNIFGFELQLVANVEDGSQKTLGLSVVYKSSVCGFLVVFHTVKGFPRALHCCLILSDQKARRQKDLGMQNQANNPFPSRMSTHQPARPHKFRFYLQYCSYAQIIELGSPRGCLAHFKSLCIGQVVEIEADWLKEDFKTMVFDDLHANTDPYPLKQIARYADNTGILHWYYSIHKPGSVPSKGVLLFHSQYVEHFVAQVSHATIVTNMVLKIWMSHTKVRDMPYTILEIFVSVFFMYLDNCMFYQHLILTLDQ
jgi:hypothetical protein